jgi:fido (protein-threonine AMPylation protein)
MTRRGKQAARTDQGGRNKKTGRYDATHLPEAQFEPGSRGKVLRNLLGIKRKREMDEVEAREQFRALRELIGIYDESHAFTGADVCKIHRTWLGPIYSWAGQYRQVNVSKDDLPFAAAREIPKLMAELDAGPLRQYTPCRFDSDDEVVKALAIVHTELMLIHPFREGNGRAGRLLAVLMGLQAKLPPLDFSGIKGKKRQGYFGAVRAGVNSDYEPMERIFSDGVQARIGSLGAGPEWFKPWRTITGEAVADAYLPELQVMIQGVFDKRRFLDLVRYFVVFEDFGGGAVTKKMAGYHQFHAVNVAVQETLRAARMRAEADRIAESRGGYRTSKQPGGKPGDRRVGVVWHTQGSGKSLTMAFYARRVILEPEMANPTLVVLTDRNDLDDQLFGTFSRCQELLRQPPVQAESRADLREKLRVEAGGVIFTTIQKFMPSAPSPQPSPSGRGTSVANGEGAGDMPCLSDRRNIVVIADEAHRSQYDFIDGFARHMRDALPPPRSSAPPARPSSWRLDSMRERPRPAPRDREANPTQVRLPAG